MNIKIIYLFYLFLNSLTLDINFKMLLVRNQVKRFLKKFNHPKLVLHQKNYTITITNYRYS